MDKIPVFESLWYPLPSDHSLAKDGYRWQKIGSDGQPEMFTTHPPEILLEGMCRAAGFSGATNASN